MTVVCGVRSSESDRHREEMTYDWEAVRGGALWNRQTLGTGR